MILHVQIERKTFVACNTSGGRETHLNFANSKRPLQKSIARWRRYRTFIIFADLFHRLAGDGAEGCEIVSARVRVSPKNRSVSSVDICPPTGSILTFQRFGYFGASIISFFTLHSDATRGNFAVSGFHVLITHPKRVCVCVGVCVCVWKELGGNQRVPKRPAPSVPDTLQIYHLFPHTGPCPPFCLCLLALIDRMILICLRKTFAVRYMYIYTFFYTFSFPNPCSQE